MGIVELLIRRGRLWAVALLCAASAGCAGGNGPEADPTVVAVVGGTHITVATVASLIPAEVDGPVVRTPDADPPDPRRVALDQAIRDELFAREAEARRLPVPPAPGGNARAARIRALIDQERAAHRLTAENVSDGQARAWYAQRHHIFDEVVSMRVSWARIGDERLAHGLLGQAADVDHEAFLALVRRHQGSGVRSSGLATLDHDGRGSEVLVARIAFALRRAGKVGLVAGEHGQWWLARVDSVQLLAPPWDESLAHRVKTALSWEAEQQRLDQLAAELKQKWPVQVFTDRLAGIRETP